MSVSELVIVIFASAFGSSYLAKDATGVYILSKGQYVPHGATLRRIRQTNKQPMRAVGASGALFVLAREELYCGTHVKSEGVSTNMPYLPFCRTDDVNSPWTVCMVRPVGFP